MSNHTTEFTFTKTILTEDDENEFDAREKAKAHMLNLLNQIEDNQSFIKNWMKITTKIQENKYVEIVKEI